MAGLARLARIHGTSVLFDEAKRVVLWNRIEFLKGKGWAEVRISPIEEGSEPRSIHVRDILRIHLIGMVMDLLAECGGPDIETNMKQPCPAGCEDGYVRDGDGNYDRCPVCGAD